MNNAAKVINICRFAKCLTFFVRYILPVLYTFIIRADDYGKS